MNLPILRLARNYAAALSKYLRQDLRTGSGAALRLGRQTTSLRLRTLDLARIHEAAMTALVQSGTMTGKKAAHRRRAETFFAEASAAIEEHYRAPGRSDAAFTRLEADLETRTRELAAANRQRRRAALRCKAVEEASEKRRVLHKRCLDESLELQNRLRQLTQRIVVAQEDDRSAISRQLQNEIAQTLIGINVRLLALQKEARGRTKRFKKDIASTQRAVVASATIVRRVARKLAPHEPQNPDLVPPLPGRAGNPPRRGGRGKSGGGAGAGK
jgi:signal transduction histidine kinase